jgi:hypothetical protein
MFLIGQITMIGMALLVYKAFVPPETVPYRLSILPPEAQPLFIPGEFVIWLDLTSRLTQGCIIIVILSSACMEILSGILIYQILRTLKSKTTKFSATTLRIHRQFTLLLAAEFITPLVLVTAPLSIHLVRVLVFNEFPPRVVTQIILIFIGFYGLANGFSTIFFITPYRIHFLKAFVFPLLNLILELLKITSTSSNQVVWATTSVPRRTE